MAAPNAWGPANKTKTLSVTDTSSSATWADGDNGGDVLRLVITVVATGVVIFVRTGKGATTATSADIPIPAVIVTYLIGIPRAHDTVALIANAGTATVYATKGEGL